MKYDPKSYAENLIAKEWHITCPLLTADRFIQYCKDRGVRTSRKQLERLEELGLLYPVMRVRYPKIKQKIEFVDDGKRYKRLGLLEEGESWDGEVREERAGFSFRKECASEWLKEKRVWAPAATPFESWDSFKGDGWELEADSFYSRFQIYALHHLVSSLSYPIAAEKQIGRTREETMRLIELIEEWSHARITSMKERGLKQRIVGLVCQAISNRLSSFPKRWPLINEK